MIVKLKKHQVVNLFNSLRSLDKPDSQEDKERIINSPYKFKAAAIYALSKNFRKVRSAVIDIEKIREKMLNEAKENPDDKELRGDRMRKFVEDYNTFLESETELDLHPVRLADLDLDNNAVPITVLSELVDTIIVES